ncbi:hypothetical protein LPJ59_005754, partial [Coemansia sp. RSA 2399]
MKISTFAYTLAALAPTLVLGQAPAPDAQQPVPAGQASAAPDANVVVGNQVLPPGLATPPVVVDATAPSAGAAANAAPSAGAQANPAPTPSPNASTPPANNAAEGASAVQPATNNQNGQANNVQMPGMQMESSANAQALEPSVAAGMMQPQIPNPSLGNPGFSTSQSSSSSESSSEHPTPTVSSSSSSSESSESSESGSSGSNGEESGLDSDVSSDLDSGSDELDSESDEHESSASHRHSSSEEESDSFSEGKSSHESHMSSDEFESDERSSGAMGMFAQRRPLDAVL